jgi:hypothetical protein
LLKYRGKPRKPVSRWPVAGTSGCVLTTSQQSGKQKLKKIPWPKVSLTWKVCCFVLFMLTLEDDSGHNVSGAQKSGEEGESSEETEPVRHQAGVGDREHRANQEIGRDDTGTYAGGSFVWDGGGTTNQHGKRQSGDDLRVLG